MTPHPLVTQLKFTRGEWVRGLRSVTAAEAQRRFAPINPIAWMICHLAWQEQALAEGHADLIVAFAVPPGLGALPPNLEPRMRHLRLRCRGSDRDVEVPG